MLAYIEIFGRTVPSYGLLMCIGLLLAGTMAAVRCHKQGLDLCDFFIIAATAMGCGLAGAKVLYWVVTYSPKEFWLMLGKKGLSILNEGGLVFYGGLLGGFAGALIGARLAKTRLFDYEAAVIPCIPLGHAVGRLGCIAAGCCYGFAYSGPFAIYYPFLETGCFPVQAVEAVGNVVIALALVRRARKSCRRGWLTCQYIFFYGLQRFFLEFLRGDRARGQYGCLSTSQWLSLGLLAVGAAVTLRLRCKNKSAQNI